MKVTLNTVAALCIVAATAVICTALGTGAEGEQLAVAGGATGTLLTIAGTIAGRTKGQS